jgi:GT2 family glycosyltransferase
VKQKRLKNYFAVGPHYNGGVLGHNQRSEQLPSVAIVIVTRNRCDSLLRLLSQIRELDYPREILDIFMLDNASTDGTGEKVKRFFPKAHLISNPKNLGIAISFNRGIRWVLKAERKYKYIWLLDDDAEVESQTLMPLVKAAEKDSSIAVVGSAVYEPNKRNQLITAGIRIVWKRTGLVYHIPRIEEADSLFDVEIIPSCSSLTRTDAYREIGLWDERFWLFWGDIDWCIRALRKGYRVCCFGKSRVWHKNWVETKRHFYTPYAIHAGMRGALLFYLRHNPLPYIASIRKYILKGYLKAAFESFTLRPNFARAYDEGVQDFLKGHFFQKDFRWSNDTKLDGLDDICRNLSKKIQKNPRIILNQIADGSQKTEIKKVFQNHFHQITWEEIQSKEGSEKLDPREPLKDWLCYHFPRFLLHLFTCFNRKDIILSSIDVLNFSNITAARHTILLDPSLRSCLRKNRIFKAFVDFFTTIKKGLRVAYFDLPYSLNNCRALKEAVEEFSKASQPIPPGIEDFSTRVF